ncbi:MAG: peptidylprolyl isomerase [Rhodobacteraceae bacterium]|nr:peptidylprolyl isomerase [Paracoccaceae bacterium]
MADAPAEMPAETEMTGHITAQSVVATYNGTPITLGQMIITASQLPPQYQQLPPDVLFTGVLDQLIQQQALADTVGHDPLRVTIALENERRALLAGEAVDAIMQAAVNDDAVASAYASAFASAAPVIEYNASHVLVATQEEAMAVIHRLDAGEAFADLARELSSDPGSGTNGGNLGWFAAGMMVEPFQNAVSMLDVGAVSVPIETQFGWHVIMLDDTREQQPPALDEIRGEIISQLQQDALEQHLADLTKAAQIIRPEPGAFDPALLSDLTLLQE